jgi:large subunit ribosomal protein L15
MELHTLRPPAGSTKAPKRVGRGPGSGMGKTSAKGHKGARARAGYKDKRYFEGGQMPLHRRLPKFGFTNTFKDEFQVVNLADLARCTGNEVTSVTLKLAGVIRSVKTPIKVLGNGTVDRPFTVKAAAFSKSAITKIEAAGGKTEVTK